MADGIECREYANDVESFAREFESGVLTNSIISMFPDYTDTCRQPLGQQDIITEFVDVLTNLKISLELYPPNHFFIIAAHEDRVHLSHICAYSNRCCRCPWVRKTVHIQRPPTAPAWANYSRLATRASQLRPNIAISIFGHKTRWWVQ